MSGSARRSWDLPKDPLSREALRTLPDPSQTSKYESEPLSFDAMGTAPALPDSSNEAEISKPLALA